MLFKLIDYTPVWNYNGLAGEAQPFSANRRGRGARGERVKIKAYEQKFTGGNLER
jgi:hypothetical protein